MTSLPTRPSLTAVVIAVTLGACANVHQVTVTPSVVCPGEPITVSWAASGNTSLAVVPLVDKNRAAGEAADYCVDALASAAAFKPEPSRGKLTVTPTQDTVYFVESQTLFGKPAHGCARLFVNQVLPLAAVPACLNGPSGTTEREVQAQLVRPPDSRWGSTATTGVVENINTFPVTVSHDGRSAALPAGGQTDIFKGTDPNSDWLLGYTWQTGPFCGHAGAPVPGNLSLQVQPLCPSAGQSRP